MKELKKMNKFRHKLGPGGYKATMLIWTNKEQELHEAGIPNPLKGCTVHTKNWIQGRSHTDDSGRLNTSSSEVISMVEKAKTLVLKRILVNSSHSGRKTNSAQPSKMRSIVVTHEKSLQLHRGRKSLLMKVICTRSIKHTR
jgi:hypothetical protein